MTERLTLSLEGRVALVTGASGELGRTIAATLAACGASVAVHYHHGQERAEATVARIGAAGGVAAAFAADLTDAASVAQLRESIASALGPPDIVVVNATIPYAWTHILDQPLADFESQFRAGTLQAALLAQSFIPAMIERGGGRVIGISTECALLCSPGMGAYAAGKRGLDGLLRTLAREVGPHGVTVNQVAPGWMVSDKFRQSGQERQEAYEARIPLGHRGDDSDVAHAVAFLASDLARFITGAYLTVCGGHVMPAI